MRRRFQIVILAGRVSSLGRAVLLPLGLLAWALACAPGAQGQGAGLPVVGHVEGRDISCENGTPTTGQYATVGTRLDVSDGTVVTVHSGQALMTLLAGGEVDICGPAKLTVLLSGNAITLALNFGRVRVELPARTDLRIFTPTLIGTPLDISGGARDVTVGLSLDDSLCVLASSGAIQLEHQFTGEKMIVPQAGEFFLNAGRLVPVAGTPGSCKCSASEPLSPPSPSSAEFANAAPAPAIPPAIPPAASGSASGSAAAAVEVTPPPAAAAKPVEYSQLAEANEEHPLTPAPRSEKPAAPPSSIPVYTAVLPPLTYTAGSPAPPPAAAADMVLLVREARVSPDWEFSGHVEPPEFAKAMQHALGEGSAGSKKQHAATPAADNQSVSAETPATENEVASSEEPAPKKRRGGFWASLKRVFGGSS
jgi:hypothetical protein